MKQTCYLIPFVGGERMKKRILVLAMTVFSLVIMTLPMIPTAQAWGSRRRYEKIEGVTMSLDHEAIPGDSCSFGDIEVTRGVSIGTVTLTIPGQDPLVGDWDSPWISILKGTMFDPEAVMRIYERSEMTFTGEGTTGTFEGVGYYEWRWDVPPIYFKFRLLLYGTGDFEGQILKLSYDGGPPPFPIPGYLLVPK